MKGISCTASVTVRSFSISPFKFSLSWSGVSIRVLVDMQMQYCPGLEERLAVGFGLSLFLRDPNRLRRKFCARRRLPRGYLDLSQSTYFSKTFLARGNAITAKATTQMAMK